MSKNQNYDNYHRDYINTPSGRLARRRAQNRYRHKLAAKYGTSATQAIKLHRLSKGDTMGAKGTKNLTEKDFQIVKQLHELGLPHKQISAVTGRAVNTISLICQSDTFEQHRARQAAYRAKALAAASPVQEFTKAVDDLDLGNRDLSKSDPELITALNNLAEAMTSLAKSWNTLSSKMDEVLETKRPWMFRVKENR